MITFVYITCRKDPKFEWFIDSLEKQRDSTPLQIVLVDYELQYDASRREKYDISKRFDFIHTVPFPSEYQGPHRITSKNYFASSLPRNTGIVFAKYDYIVFVDDLSVIEQDSFPHLVDYAKRKLVIAFGYKKVYDLIVRDGQIISKKETSQGIDVRLEGPEFRSIHGSQLYGYAASPKSVLFSVNGYDEICNSMGGEDYNYGIRVTKTGSPVYYSSKVLFYESEDYADQGNVFVRRDYLLTNELYDSLMKQFGVTNRWDPNGTKDLSHFALDLLMRPKSWAEGNNYNLKERHDTFRAGKQLVIPINKDLKTLEGLLVRDL